MYNKTKSLQSSQSRLLDSLSISEDHTANPVKTAFSLNYSFGAWVILSRLPSILRQFVLSLSHCFCEKFSLIKNGLINSFIYVNIPLDSKYFMLNFSICTSLHFYKGHLKSTPFKYFIIRFASQFFLSTRQFSLSWENNKLSFLDTCLYV